ncbi:hypothetical protein [Nonlabens sp. Asnod2-A12]|uniref:hypothetical protein n=1 Tax=Nonlabens sp. Asnod2-A12 TaxID=3160578 RepID=UPI00386E69AC
MFKYLRPKNAVYRFSEDKKALLINDNVKNRFWLSICLMFFGSLNLLLTVNNWGMYFKIFSYALLLFSTIVIVVMFQTHTLKNEIQRAEVDYLLFRNNKRVKQTMIRLKNGKYRNVIFNHEAHRLNFVQFMEENDFEVKRVESILPLVPLNY